MKADNFEEWLDFFMMDHNLSPNNVIYEGILDGKMFHMTYRELFDKIRPYSGMRKRLREDFSAAAYTGESVDEAASKIVQEELIDNGLI
ncbi:MAG: hypothetical protein IJ075_05875 [Lachnospiraceae bacterium]|nr:hypothetical protein [Lachnospiraceae bacterium]MBQ9607720.1 hypothetical protein [Lachnospiraceae bacterium]MBR1524026.1 hypothetical protein [Lachnospiraceae bacterium]